MADLPGVNGSDDEWYEFAEKQGDSLIPHLADFILDRFSYKPRYVQQHLWRSGITISALTKQYDLYFRLFMRPEDFWPRECLVLARVMFKQQRSGHGRALVELLLKLASELGYKYLAIEWANARASAFAQRLGFTPFEGGRHWVGSTEAIRKALGMGSPENVKKCRAMLSLPQPNELPTHDNDSQIKYSLTSPSRNCANANDHDKIAALR